MTLPLSFNDAIKRLARFGFKENQIYLIDMVLLAEMAWADGCIQKAEKEILLECIKEHVTSINVLAGCNVITEESAIAFVDNLLETRPDQELFDEVLRIIADVRINNKPPADAADNRMAILNGCLDIAASSVTKYPYGLTERFTAEEKSTYHKIQKNLSDNG